MAGRDEIRPRACHDGNRYGGGGDICEKERMNTGARRYSDGYERKLELKRSIQIPRI
jgi:hypothetical protein